MNISVSIGQVCALLTPATSIRLLTAFRLIGIHGSSKEGAAAAPPVPVTTASQPRLHASLRIKGMYIVGIYDMQAQEDKDFGANAAQFYSRPSTTFVPYGHLKFKAEGVDAVYKYRGFTPRSGPTGGSGRPLARRQSSGVQIEPPPAEITLTFTEISVFEHLATDTAAAEDENNESIPGGAYPVLIFDSNLLRQYEAGPQRRPAHSAGAASNTSSQPEFPEFEGLDWRNSGLQKKTGSNEKVWKVRGKPRGGMKGAREQVASEGPAVTINMTTAGSSRE
jgi:autophagy-related protein 2